MGDKFKVAYLILAHKNPSQITSFVNAVDCQKASFFIHIDKKSNIIDDPSLQIIKKKNNVFFIEDRQKVSWGGYGDIDATLILLRESLKRDNFDYISLHSGQDLPIKNRHTIINYLRDNPNKEFIEFFDIPSSGWWPDNGFDRIRYYWFVEEIGLDKSWELYELQKKIDDKREYLTGIKPYAGWQWWTITGECGQYIVDFVKENKEFCQYYKYTLLPDEGFFQTIIMNSHFKDRVTNDNLRYIDWKSGPQYPRIFTKYDYNRLIESDKLFARKFDENVDSKIIQMITKKID